MVGVLANSSLLALLEKDPVPMDEVAALFDAIAPDERVMTARGVPGKLQARLFEAAKGFRAMTIDDLVPPEWPAMHTVRHYGRNSLPAFRLFEKRFARPDGEVGRERLIGYNNQGLMFMTGPGHMVAYDGENGEVLVDYREVADAVPPGWPEPRSNDGGVARLVYGNMVDHLRRVSRHVSIGRAFRPDKPESAWFILCREELPV